ncbi:MAG TPA: hypothetical protein VGL86_09645 [Polyangia bacterium]|jgi:hypothetical protein
MSISCETILAAALVSLAAAAARAQTPAPDAVVHAEPPPPAAVAPPSPIDYSLPIGLRSVFAGTGARLDSSFALSHDVTNAGVFTEASVLGVSYAVRRGLAIGAKFAWVANQPPNGPAQTTVSNLALGATLTLPLPHRILLAPFLGLTLPIGMGGGNSPNTAALAADAAGVNVRAVGDNSLFAIDELAIGGGLGAAFIAHRVTVQAEVTVGEFIRVRGDQFFPDAERTAMNAGVHVGYSPLRALSFGAEFRSVVWLSTPEIVISDPTQRDTLAVAAMVRGHFKMGARMSIHPGISYTRGLTGQLASNGYNIVGLDIPVAFEPRRARVSSPTSNGAH